jgi:type I restriction enzyme S subunit
MALPEGWTEVALGDIASVNSGQSPPSSIVNDDERGIPFFQGCAEFGEIHPHPEKWIEQPLRIAETGDILLSVRAPVGAVNIAEQRCCIGRGIAAITCCDDITQRYVWHYMPIFASEMHRHSKGSTFDAINRDEILEYRLAIPTDQDEIRRITEVLDSADNSVAIQRRLIRKLEMMREGLLTDLLTYGVDDNGNLCYERTLKKSPIGMIPANWEIMSGARVSNLITKGESPAWQGYSYLEEGIIFITSENVRDGFIDISNPKYISDAFHTKLSRSQLSPRDLLINLTGASIGRFCLFPNYILTGNISQNVAVFRTINNIIEPEFAALYLQSSIGKKALLAPLKNNARGSISLGDLGKLLFIVPPAEERAVIVESYLALQDRLNIERTKLEKLLHLKEGLMTDLLTGQNRVPGPSPADVEVVV